MSATPVYKCQLIRYTGRLSWDESGDPILMVGAIAVPTLVMLTGRLPGHPESAGDLWPPDAQPDSMINQHRQLRLCPVSCEPGTFDSLKHLRYRQPGNA